MILKKVLNYYSFGGFPYLRKMFFVKIHQLLEDRKLVNYYFLHNNIRDNHTLRTEMSRWKCYLKLKKSYQKYLDTLPTYSLSGISNNTIWWCWLQGIDKAPALCQSCLVSLKKYYPDYNIVVVTEDNMFNYIHPPKHILEKYKAGIISKTHFSDLLRVMLLVENGGIWIDSTVFCTERNASILNLPFFVFKNWNLGTYPSTVASSWLICSEKEHPIMKTLQDLLFLYWEEHDVLINYFCFHFFFHMAITKYFNYWNEIPLYSNVPPHFLQSYLLEPFSEKLMNRIKGQSDFHKLTYKIDLPSDISGLVINSIINHQF